VGLDDWHNIAGIVQSGLAAATFLLAGWWFLYTTQAKPRLQFDVDLECLPLTEELILGHVMFVFENKGFVEHRFYKLEVSAHGHTPGEEDEDGRPQFSKRLLPRREILPQRAGIYFVRPGVRQVITYMFPFSRDEKVIRITASFVYRGKTKYPLTLGYSEPVPHTFRRYFKVSVTDKK
jgi:hypothetical protein